MFPLGFTFLSHCYWLPGALYSWTAQRPIFEGLKGLSLILNGYDVMLIQNPPRLARPAERKKWIETWIEVEEKPWICCRLFFLGAPFFVLFCLCLLLKKTLTTRPDQGLHGFIGRLQSSLKQSQRKALSRSSLVVFTSFYAFSIVLFQKTSTSFLVVETLVISIFRLLGLKKDHMTLGTQ